MFEMCGLGCASGPLTGRFTLPFTVAAHFLWPGSIKLPDTHVGICVRLHGTPFYVDVGNASTPSMGVVVAIWRYAGTARM